MHGIESSMSQKRPMARKRPGGGAPPGGGRGAGSSGAAAGSGGMGSTAAAAAAVVGAGASPSGGVGGGAAAGAAGGSGGGGGGLLSSIIGDLRRTNASTNSAPGARAVTKADVMTPGEKLMEARKKFERLHTERMQRELVDGGGCTS